MEFELSDAHPEDLDAMMSILSEAWRHDDIWSHLMRNVKPEDEHKWLMEDFGKRFYLPDNKYFKVTEAATGKLIAWTSLAIPCVLTPEQKAFAEDDPDLPKGLDMEIGQPFIEKVDPAAKAYGYDPEKHCHRKGTMVHVDYQRRGLGSILTKHCNDIADALGVKTFVVARAKSKRLFEALGFVIIGEANIDMTKFGLKSDGRNWILVREPERVKGSAQ